VGNTLIDTLLKHINKFQKPQIWYKAGPQSLEYLVITLHRPANVEGEQQLKSLLQQIITHSRRLPIVFLVHPRTAKVLSALALDADDLHLIEPLSYLEFNFEVKKTKAIITDSGGIREETTVMKVP
jgi:UDP-N-acetylglucosamine 2-epimerase (non-hydrolysing)